MTHTNSLPNQMDLCQMDFHKAKEQLAKTQEFVYKLLMATLQNDTHTQYFQSDGFMPGEFCTGSPLGKKTVSQNTSLCIIRLCPHPQMTHTQFAQSDGFMPDGFSKEQLVCKLFMASLQNVTHTV